MLPKAQTTVTKTTKILINVTRKERKRKYMKKAEINTDKKTNVYISLNTRRPI